MFELPQLIADPTGLNPWLKLVFYESHASLEGDIQTVSFQSQRTCIVLSRILRKSNKTFQSH